MAHSKTQKDEYHKYNDILYRIIDMNSWSFILYTFQIKPDIV